MAIVIRAGRESDLDQIAQVLVDTWRSTFRGSLSNAFLDGMTYRNQAERRRRTFRRGGVAYFVACSADDQVVGFVNGGPIRHALANYKAELYALYVRDTFQGQGVGARLVIALAQELVERGFPNMSVWVLAMNPNAPFYERMGASRLATARLQLGPDEVDEVAYVWNDLSGTFG
jgi:GNAT superfamily N-acetyltransferase